MALTTPQISATESIGYPNLVTLLDDSIGTDLTLTNRKVYVTTADGTKLEDGLDWPYANSTIQIDLLTESTSPTITIKWFAGATQMYEFIDEFVFNLYDYIFALGLLQDLTSAPGTLQDQNYYNNFMQFIVNLFNSESAILYGGDIYSSQNALNLNRVMINNETKYF